MQSIPVRCKMQTYPHTLVAHKGPADIYDTYGTYDAEDCIDRVAAAGQPPGQPSRPAAWPVGLGQRAPGTHAVGRLGWPGGWPAAAALSMQSYVSYVSYVSYISYLFLQGRPFLRSLTRRMQDSKAEPSGFLQGRLLFHIFDPPEAGLPILVPEFVDSVNKQIRDYNILVQYKHPGTIRRT